MNENFNFYLPDTFAPGTEAFPSNLEKFQKFNLTLAKKNKAISRNLEINSLIDFTMLLTNRDIRFRTALKTISHLLKEQYQPKNKQGGLYFNLF